MCTCMGKAFALNIKFFFNKQKKIAFSQLDSHYTVKLKIINNKVKIIKSRVKLIYF